MLDRIIIILIASANLIKEMHEVHRHIPVYSSLKVLNRNADQYLKLPLKIFT